MAPLLVLLAGMVAVLGAIIVLRLHAFLALIGSAILVSLLAPGDPAVKIARVAEGFGRTAGSIGIVIALAAIIGTAMTRSGAADRIVQAFLRALGEKRGDVALCGTGFVLGIPVFFDTVFYLLVPLARSMHRRTGRHYLRYVLAIGAGGAATHTLVPPTPGPLAVAGTLGVDVGRMVLVGFAVALPGALAALLYARWLDRRMPVPLRPLPGDEAALGDEPAGAAAGRPLPGLALALLPIVLPVLLIAANTLAAALTGPTRPPGTPWHAVAPWAAVLGNANLALLLSAVVAIGLYVRARDADGRAVAALVEESLAGAGPIILITAAGGAFGAMLQAAEVGPAVERLFADGAGGGLALLALAFVVASVIKVAQGSSTVAMITTAGMLAAMIGTGEALPFDPVYVAAAIGCGALVGSWMNDSGFWVISRLGGLTAVETLRAWTPLAAIVGGTAMVVTVTLALLVPLR